MVTFRSIQNRCLQIKEVKSICTKLNTTLLDATSKSSTKIRRLERLRNMLSQNTAMVVRDLDKLIRDLKKERDERHREFTNINEDEDEV